MRKVARVKLRPKLEAITPNNDCIRIVKELRRLADDVEAGKATAVIMAASFRPTEDEPYGSTRCTHVGDWPQRIGLAGICSHRINKALDE
jgi:hypothetical protein